MQAGPPGWRQSASSCVNARSGGAAAERVRSSTLVSLSSASARRRRGAMRAAEILTVDASHAGARQYLVEGYTRTGNAARAQQLRRRRRRTGSPPARSRARSAAHRPAVGARPPRASAGAVEASNKNPSGCARRPVPLRPHSPARRARGLPSRAALLRQRPRAGRRPAGSAARVTVAFPLRNADGGTSPVRRRRPP